jgi:hypothetical protein
MTLSLALASLDATGVRAAVEAARAAAGTAPAREQLRARAVALALRLLLGLMLRAGAPRVRDTLVLRAAEHAQQTQRFTTRALTLNEDNAVQLVARLCQDMLSTDELREQTDASPRATSDKHNKPSRPSRADNNNSSGFTRQRIARLAVDTTYDRNKTTLRDSAASAGAASSKSHNTRDTRASREARRAAIEYGNRASLKYRIMHSRPATPNSRRTDDSRHTPGKAGYTAHHNVGLM